MLCREEQAKLAGWKIEIIATDISTEMVERAREGIYGQFEVQRGLPIQYLTKYFKQVQDRWQLSAEIRSAVQFREFNLLNDPRQLGTFDVVFCRNVLIYFDRPTKEQVLGRIADRLPEDGILFLGGSETVLGISDRFEQLSNESGLYRRAARATAPVAVGWA
jgi:chemotaxis protein methyltransferase CheR